MRLILSITSIIFLCSISLRGQESRVALFFGNPEERVQSFDTLVYENMTSMSLKIAKTEDFKKYERLLLTLTCKLAGGGRKALKPKKYYAEYEIPLDRPSMKSSNSIRVIVFDEKGHSDFGENVKRKFKNFSISPIRKRWLEFWASYEYQFKLYGFQKSNNKKNISDTGNSSEEQYKQGDVLGMSSTFHVRSSKRKRPRVGALLLIRDFFGKCY